MKILEVKNLLSFWDFDIENPLLAKGKFVYRLVNGSSPVDLVNEGPISGHSIDIKEGQYLFIPRKDCPGLNLHGKNTEVTVLAWVKRQHKSFDQCEAIAGMWDETRKKRQYCLFLNIQLYDSKHQVSGHISGVGGPTPDEKWAIDVAIGQTPVMYNEWTFIGFTFDGKQAKSYINGLFDEREGLNPFNYDQGLFDGEMDGADFTVGAVHRLGEMGNDFVGQIGGLAIFDKALSEKEIYQIYKNN